MHARNTSNIRKGLLFVPCSFAGQVKEYKDGSRRLNKSRSQLVDWLAVVWLPSIYVLASVYRNYNHLVLMNQRCSSLL